MTETYRIQAIALHEVGVFDDVRIDFPPISSPERDAQKAKIHVFTGPSGVVPHDFNYRFFLEL